MRLTELFETPIADISLQGKFDDENPAFSQVDRGIIQSPKGRDKIMRAFSKTPHVFKVIFRSDNNYPYDGDNAFDNGSVDDIAVKMRAGVHDTYAGVVGEPGVIKVLLLSNFSPLKGKMPLTAWTLAHKIGHAFQDEMYNKGWRHSPYEELVREINAILGLLSTRDADKLPDAVAFGYPEELARHLTMKSARSGKLDNSFEMFAEVVAQYLIQGKVTFNAAPHITPELVRTLNAAIHSLFQAMEGKVLVEV